MVAECCDACKRIDDEFNKFLGSIAELQLLCIEDQSVNEGSIQEAKTSLASNAVLQKRAEKNAQLAQKFMDKCREQLQMAWEQYAKAVDAVPHGYATIP
jgi:hypothetical protein